MARATRNQYVYVADDHGAQFPDYSFNMMIPDAEAGDASRGWLIAAGAGPSLQHHMKPRHVIGRDAGGHSARAICATVSCDLYAGVATTFDVNGVTYTVTGYVGEKRTANAPRA